MLLFLEISNLVIFPKLTEDVIFINNILYNLSRKTLENLTNLTIKYLNLNSNDIRFIDNDTFLDLRHMTKFDISRNVNHLNIYNMYSEHTVLLLRSLKKQVEELRVL
jgi:hypothetical protein